MFLLRTICFIFLMILSQQAECNYFARDISIINTSQVGEIKYVYKDKLNRYIVLTNKGIYIQRANSLQQIKSKKPLDFKATKFIITDDFLLIVCDGQNNFASAVLTNTDDVQWQIVNTAQKSLFEKLDNKSKLITEQKVKNTNKPVAYKGGFLSNNPQQEIISNAYFIKENNKWYELINDNYTFKTNKQFPNYNPRIVCPLSDNWVLLSFDVNNSIFLHNTKTDSVVDLYKKNKNVLLPKAETIFLHAFSGLQNDVYLLGSNSILYNLSLTDFKISLTKVVNDVKLDLKNVTVGLKKIAYFGSYTGNVCAFNLVTKQVKVYSRDEHIGLNDVNRLYIDEYGLLWLGMVKGFAVINPQNNEVYVAKNKLHPTLVNNFVTAIVRIKNKLWLGSYSTGLWYIELPNNFNETLNVDDAPFQSLLENNKFIDNNVRYMNTLNDTLIIRTVDNLYLLSQNNMILKNIKLSESVGVSLKNQYNYIQNNLYYTGIFNGYCMVSNITTIFNVNNYIHFDEIASQNFTKLLPYNWYNDLSITVNSSDGYIAFTPMLYNSDLKSFLPYKVNGKRYQTLANGSAIILLSNSGKLEVEFLNDKNIVLAQNLKFTIYVLQPWYASIWFKFLIGALFLSILLIIYQLKKASIRYKNESVINEITSLRGQLNPHFISNSLNSINAFVLQNKSEQASDYIVKFAKLMHLILRNSTQEFITIDEELKMLNTYLEMEKLRFKDKFSYSIQNNDDNLHYLIPSMILQPFVENAIWHGLLQQKSNGLLQIVIEPLEKNIMITITDNGIGRKASEEIKSKQTTKRKSYGMQIVQKRIVLLEKLHNRKYNIAIIDLHNPTGTQVKLIL